MLTRISLIVAILAALVVGGLNFVLVKDKITALQGNLKTETEGRQKAETDFKRTSDELSKTNAALAQTKGNLDATTEDKNKALADLDAQTKRADKLSEDLKKTRDERDTAQSELAAYKATGLSPQQAASANKLIKSLEDT